MKMNALILLATVALGFGVTYMLESSSKPANTLQAQEMGKEIFGKLPDFSMNTLDGKPHNINDFIGKTVVINFWASWCPPCIAEFPRLLEIAALYPDNVVLLAISGDEERQAIDNFIAKLDDKNRDLIQRENVLIIHDKDSHITFNVFGTSKLPETIIAGPDQQMLHKLVGADWGIEDVTPFINQPESQ